MCWSSLALPLSNTAFFLGGGGVGRDKGKGVGGINLTFSWTPSPPTQVLLLSPSGPRFCQLCYSRWWLNNTSHLTLSQHTVTIVCKQGVLFCSKDLFRRLMLLLFSFFLVGGGWEYCCREFVYSLQHHKSLLNGILLSYLVHCNKLKPI